MTRWIVAGLIVVNLLLGAGVYLRLGGETPAKAQIGGGMRNLATVAGQANNQSIVYILDVNTGILVAMDNNPGQGVKFLARRDVAQDLKRIK